MVADSQGKKIRVLVAKPGLDGHDRGAKVVALALREAGMEVIYTGLHQTIDQVVKTAVEEDVDVIGLSILSGAHLPLTEALMKRLEEERMKDKKVVVGGVIPEKDIDRLKQMGVSAVFPTATPFEEIIETIRGLVAG
jgi:methylmalonyl-CoA mutase C-terminal domain/subunit